MRRKAMIILAMASLTAQLLGLGALSEVEAWEDNNGVVWSDPIKITSHAAEDNRPSIIEFSPHGLLPQVWIFWHSFRTSPGPDIFHKISGSPENQADWLSALATQLTTSSNNYRPASARMVATSSWAGWDDGQRSLWVAWGTVGGIHYKYHYQPIPAQPWIWAWSGDFLLPNSAGGQDPSIIQTSDGFIYIAWGSGGDISFARSTDGGQTWSFLPLLDNGGNEMYPSMAQADHPWPGVIWVAFHSDVDGDNEIYYAEYDPPVTFLSTKKLTANLTRDEHPTIIKKQNGHIWIAWDSGLIYSGLSYKLTSDGGLIWTPAVDISRWYGGINQVPWLTQTFDGKVWVAWATNRDGNLDIYAMYGVQPSDIPTLTEWGLIIFGLVLVGFITWVFLKRRRVAALT